MVGEFQSFYSDSLRDRAKNLGWTTNQVMTLASIVEGEAILDEERPLISGVYHNRLRKGMRLEADPTIRYVIENVPRRILYSDLEIDDPYNTYRNRGLPPGPINNPGRKSILAALWPAKTDYLFFVANGKGGHWFSSNYTQHLRFVHKYRRERRLRVSKSLTESSRTR
jgi:peptidoglycan lytic transglycosylase G